MLLNTEDDTSIEISSRAELERALANLGADGNGYAVLECEEQIYIQAAATGRDRFVAEYRDGSEEAHFSSARKNLSLAEVVELFGSYLEDTEGWKTSIEWRRMSPSMFFTPRPKQVRVANAGPRPRGRANEIPSHAVLGAKSAMVYAVMFGIVGAVLLALGVREVVATRMLLARAEPGRGTVVANTRPAALGRSAAYYPVVEFRARDGHVRSFQDRTGNVPPRYQVGDAVVVLYDPSRPEDARIDDRSSLWVGGILAIAFSAVFWGIAPIVLLQYMARGRRRPPPAPLVRG
jgi:hypothetical protein